MTAMRVHVSRITYGVTGGTKSETTESHDAKHWEVRADGSVRVVAIDDSTHFYAAGVWLKVASEPDDPL
jgi:hypothetical protein